VEIFSLVTNLPPAPAPMASWVDSDSDGDLDLFTTAGIVSVGGGYSPQGSVLWRNDEGTNFFAIPAGALAVVEGAAAWADFKRKGTIDLLLTGRLSPPNYPFSALYTNSGLNTFVEVTQFQWLPDVWNSAADAGDFDNNGSPDLVIAGETYNPEAITRVYRNRNGTFSSTDFSLSGIYSGAALWADYDNDADLDLLLTGATNTITSSTGLTRLYRNDDGTNFVDVQAAFPPLSFSAAGWADFDHDGDLDLALSGWDGTNGFSGIFRNTAGTFSDIAAGLRGVSAGEVTWGDFTGDGWTDLLLTGSTNLLPSGAITLLYRNDRDGTFSEMPCNLPPSFWGSAVCGDYDRDGDLDVCLVGKGPNDWSGAVFRNNSPHRTPTPAPPLGLTAAVNGRAVELNWAPSTNFSASHVASYNLRVGTMPRSPDVMPPHSLTNGARQLARLGNAGAAPRWKLHGLMPGVYYWSVQAISDSFAASPFSSEGTFTITNTRPIATPLSFILAEDSVLGITLAGFDAESTEMTFEIVDQATNGLVTGISPFFIYRPQSNYFGADSFRFTANDGLTNSEPALVTLNIIPIQDTPTLYLSLRQLPGGAREFGLIGEPSALHVIESSQDLSQWSPVMSVRAAATGRVTFTVAPGTDKQFYRVRPTLP